MPTRSIFPMSETAVGLALRKQMYDLDITQKEFAYRLRLNQSHLSQVMNGRALFTPSLAAKLNTLGIDGTYLFLCSLLHTIQREQEKLRMRNEKSTTEDNLYVL